MILSLGRAALLVGALVSSASAALAQGVDGFRVTLPNTFDGPVSGRLIVSVIREGSKLGPDERAVDGPFWDDPQPIFGMDVVDLLPGASVLLDGSKDFFPVPPEQLADGRYRVAARLDRVRATSDWKGEEGNLFSSEATVETGPWRRMPPVELTLDQRVEAEAAPAIQGVEKFEMRSTILSAFHGRDVFLAAGVVFPRNYDPNGSYPVIYHVSGFGGNWREAFGIAQMRDRAQGDSPLARLASGAFSIVLDAESPNGHTLWADSANNGPVGQALIEELIPALERRYALKPQISARVLRGHSSGGWSTIWLGLTYPDTFGAVWSSAPDPLTFEAFQTVNIYSDTNFYRPAVGQNDFPSYRESGVVKMTIRQENGGEEVLGPDNTSGQQWDSWFAVFGPRNAAGHPAALFDPRSGDIDPAVAASYRRYDMVHLLRQDPARLGRLWATRIRLVMPEEDSFYLERAARILAAELERLVPESVRSAGPGYVKIVPGFDHSSIFASQEIRSFPEQMVDHFVAAGHLSPKP